MENNIPIYVVHLENEVHKKEDFIMSNHNNLPYYEFFPAIDGKTLKKEDIGYDVTKTLRVLYREITDGELGCYVSHMLLYKKLLKSSYDHFLIFEDDIIINKEIYTIVEKIIQSRIKFDIVLLQNYNPKKCFDRKKVIKWYSYELYKSLDEIWGTSAYIISRRGAKKMCKYHHNIYLPIDILGRGCKIIGNYFLDVYFVKPNLVVEKKYQSGLEKERNDLWHAQKMIKSKKYQKRYKRVLRYLHRISKLWYHYSMKFIKYVP